MVCVLCSIYTRLTVFVFAVQLNYAGFPVELPGTVDLHQHAHLAGVVLKSHEDTLACRDVLQVVRVASSAASKRTFIFKPLHGLFDHAWAFLKSTKRYIKTHSLPWSAYSSDEEEVDETEEEEEEEDEPGDEDEREEEAGEEAGEEEPEEVIPYSDICRGCPALCIQVFMESLIRFWVWCRCLCINHISQLLGCHHTPGWLKPCAKRKPSA